MTPICLRCTKLIYKLWDIVIWFMTLAKVRNFSWDEFISVYRGKSWGPSHKTFTRERTLVISENSGKHEFTSEFFSSKSFMQWAQESVYWEKCPESSCWITLQICFKFYKTVMRLKGEWYNISEIQTLCNNCCVPFWYKNLHVLIADRI